MQRLFVYGSLGPGRPNEHLMQKIGGQWQAASLRGRLLEKGWGAGMVSGPGDRRRRRGNPRPCVVSDRLAEHWPALDEFEGSEYRRVATRVTLADGAQVDAYVYALRD
ncbi:TPA: gamma-glutamylcyclotransferase [Pseudomonas aeruginosa]|nr:gamma-glutamylcyclotransferase [Pseudomonas aeruginosa]HEP9635675.1 gamma-glutamylcyclotransferase [Pseudomonas aeruginosa]